MSNRNLLHCDLTGAQQEGESGQALVELAVTLPLLVLLLLGAGILGMVTYTAIEVSNAARAGAQYAAMNGGGFMDTGASGGIAQAAEYDAYNTWTLNPQNFSVSSSYSCACTSSGDTAICTAGTAPTGCANSRLIVTVTVNTQATFASPLYLPGLPKSFTLAGQAIQKVPQ